MGKSPFVYIHGLFAFLFFIFCELGPVAAEDAIVCTSPIHVFVEPIDAVRTPLQKDPFAKAFPVYLKDLKAEDGSIRTLADRMNRLMKDTCVPLNSDINDFNRRILDFNRDCTHRMSENAYAACIRRYEPLKKEEGSLEIRKRDFLAELKHLGEDGAAIILKLRPALDRAKDFLNPANTVLVVRMYADRLVKDVMARKITSCGALVKIAEGLSKRDTDIYVFSRDLVQALAADDNPMVDPRTHSTYDTRFNDSGFKNEFQDLSDQVRHAVGYFAFGVNYSGIGSDLVSFFRDMGENLGAEQRLAHVAGQLGWEVRLGGVGLRDIPREMKKRFCE